MSTSNDDAGTRLEELKPGDRIEVEQSVTEGDQRRRKTTRGTVVRIERCRYGLPLRRATEAQGASDVILLELGDGELTAVTMDDSTVLRRAVPR
jgi:ribosomal protein L19